MMPTTWPAALTSAPPESPGLISASDWIMPVSCSELVPFSLAVIDWLRAVIWPSVTRGAPPRPRALPTLAETGVTVWIGASAAALWLVMNRARFQPTPMPPPVATITAAMTAAVRRFAYPGPWVGGATAAGVAVAGARR